MSLNYIKYLFIVESRNTINFIRILNGCGGLFEDISSWVLDHNIETQEFPANQFLWEIIFGVCGSSKIAILTILEPLNFKVGEIVQFFEAEM